MRIQAGWDNPELEICRKVCRRMRYRRLKVRVSGSDSTALRFKTLEVEQFWEMTESPGWP